MFFAAIWLLLFLKDLFLKYVLKKPTGRAEPFMINFKLRFLYEVLFEICLCAVIYLSYTDFGKTTTGLIFTISLLAIVFLFSCMCFCFSLGFKNGPYVEKLY